MTEEERKKAIREALEILRDDIEKMRNECADKITPHLKAFNTNLHNEGDIYDSIESLAEIDACSFFETVGFDMMNMCEDIALCAEWEE